MVGSVFKKSRLTGFAVLVLCINTFRLFPDLHHHEEIHACVGAQGNFYHLETDPHQHTDHRGETIPHLVRIKIGDAHDHELCALCQFIPSLLDSRSDSRINGDPVQDWYAHHNKTSLARGIEAQRPRGPPLGI